MPSPTLSITRAVLIPMKGDRPDTGQKFDVQFNPATLRVSLSNTLKADSRGASQPAAAQFVDKSESSLTVELLFDTTTERGGAQANSDVRKLTQKIAETFMKPVDAGGRQPKAPQRCRFQWGSFQFTGMISSYGETLDYFAPEGVPLRATLALTLKEDRYQFDFTEGFAGITEPRNQPTFVSGGPGVTADQASQAAGKSPRDWRSVADANGAENPRQMTGDSIAIPASGSVSWP